MQGISLTDNLYEAETDNIKKILSEKFPFNQTDFGKMIRSKLGILTLKACGKDVTDNHLKYLSAIELVHNASLLHDDIIDNQKTRRGSDNPADSNMALLYGNILTVNAFEILIGLNNIELLTVINSAVNNMCKGELLQQAQLYKIPTMDEYLEKTRLKTAELFRSIYKGLNVLSDNALPDKLEQFFDNYGIAFQIKNDLDNILSDKTDIQNGIYTAPVIFENNIDISPKSLEKTLSLIDNYRSKGVNILADLKNSPYKEELVRIAECLKN